MANRKRKKLKAKATRNVHDNGQQTPSELETEIAVNKLMNKFRHNTMKDLHPKQDEQMKRVEQYINVAWMQYLVNWRTGTRSGLQNGFLRAIASKLENHIDPSILTIKYDSYGNMYVEKRTTPDLTFIPCIVAHVDIVSNIAGGAHGSVQLRVKDSKDDLILIGEKLEHKDPTGKQEGPGFDDKCGVYYALRALSERANLKAVFFKDEEAGCIGSREVDLNFFNDVSLIIQLDKAGTSVITDETNGVTVVSKPFQDAVEPIIARYGYKWSWGSVTDVGEIISKGVGISGVNIACGYENAHSAYEELDVKGFYLAMKMADEIIDEMGDVRWLHTAVSADYGYGYSHSGMYEGYYSDSNKLSYRSYSKVVSVGDYAHSVVTDIEAVESLFQLVDFEDIYYMIDVRDEDEEKIFDAAIRVLEAHEALHNALNDRIEKRSREGEQRLLDIVGEDYSPPPDDDGGEVDVDDPFHVGKA